MNKKKSTNILILLYSLFIIVAVITLCIALCIEYSNKNNVFFSEDETRINTDIVVSYTVIDKQGNSLTYDEADEKFNTIRSILSSAKVYHDKRNLYIVDEKSSEHIILKSKSKDIVFIPLYEKQPDGSILLILKDFCKNRSTTYQLDNHDYLVTNISETEYQEIFS